MSWILRLQPSIVLLPIVGLMVLHCAPAAGPDRATVAEHLAVRHPSLDGVDVNVRNQIEQQRAIVESGWEISRNELGAAYGKLGQLYHVYGLFEAAEGCYRNARAILPADERWSYYLGVVHLRRGQPDQAIEALHAASESGGERPALWMHIAAAHRDLNNTKAAEEAYRRALELDGSLVAAHYGLGELAVLAGDDQAASRHFEAALSLDPGATRVHYPLGLVYRRLGNEERATELLAASGGQEIDFPDPLMDEVQALAEGPSFHLQRGNLAGLEGDPEEQIAAYREAVAADESDVVAWESLALALTRAGSPGEATEELARASRLNPGNARLLMHWGRSLVLSGSLANGKDKLRQAIASDPELVEARVALAETLSVEGDLGAAIDELERALELDPGNDAIRVRYAERLIEVGRESEATAQLSGLLDRQPANHRARMALVSAAFARHDWSRVVEQCNILLASDPPPEVRAAALSALGAVAVRRGESGAARNYLTEALAADPENASARLQFAGLEGRSSNYEEAANHYLKIVEQVPDHSDARLGAATALVLAGDHARALEVLEQGLELRQVDPNVVNALARFLATVPDAELRDGERAMRLAQELFARGRSPEYGITAAMAFAAMGDFDEAIQLHTAMVERMGGGVDAQTRQRLARNLENYRNRQRASEW